MNEFTKEELQIIADWSLELRGEYGTAGDKAEKALDIKIQSMIDNYIECAHIHTLTDAIVKCSECSQILGYGDE